MEYIMKKEAFVYKWINLTNGKIYIGYHKGLIDDGYISSSKSKEFWDDFNNPTNNWIREILFVGSKNECLTYEQSILNEIDLRSDNFYNNARGANIIFTEEVLDKMSSSAKRRWDMISDDDRKKRADKISNSKKGIPRSEETKRKLREHLIGKTFIDRFGEEKAREIGERISKNNTGKHYHSDEHKSQLSSKMMGNKLGALQSDEIRNIKRIKWTVDNPGKNPTEETKRKISQSKMGTISPFRGVARKKITCPHCGKVGGDGLMQRWHFDNCKNKL